MRRAAFAALLSLALTACARGGRVAACSAGETNRCTCTGGGEGLQQCLPSGEAFGACVCADACAGGACVTVPSLIGMDMDQAGAAVEAAGLRLPDPVDPEGFVTVEQIADPPVHVLDQSPPAGTRVQPGTRLTLTVTLPPDQESLGLPTSNFLVGGLLQDTETTAEHYYDLLDPGPFPTRATLLDWKNANGFGTPADAEASAIYMTHTDLGFGRHMHMRRKGKRVAFYVDNYPTIEDAIGGTRFFATVAMEYSPGPLGKETDPYFTQFYVFDKKGQRITDPILDDHGPKQNPSVCLVCHGGFSDTKYAQGANLGAHFIPFDVDAESFLDRPGYRRDDQQAAFKAFNEAVAVTWQDAAATYPPGDPAPVPELIDLWYGGPGHPSSTFISGVTLDGWSVSPEAQDLYHRVVSKSCQTCHAQRDPTRNFSTYAKFVTDKTRVQTRVFAEAAMPLSQRGYLNFWLSYPHQPKVLAQWLGIALRAPGHPVPRVSVAPSATVVAGKTVVLDGSQSQFAETFEWQQTAGTSVQLAPQTVNESKVAFVAPPRGSSLSFALRVSSLGNTSAPLAVNVLSRSVPDAPASVQALPGAGSATVQWTPPAFDGLSAITGYTVTVTPGGAILSADASTTSLVVGSLQPGITYTFAVAAVNAVGAGLATTASLRIPTLPGAPVAVSAASTHAGGTLDVSWTPNADTGGVPLTGYAVTCVPSGSASAGGSATDVAVSGLANGTSYSCTVVATNVAGSSAPSAAATGIPDGPPAPPTGFTASNAGGADWDLSWTKPVDTGGVPLTGYVITWTPETGVGPIQVADGVTAVRIGAGEGLVPGTTYTFSVAATNAIGTGAAATTTPPAKPVITSPFAGGSTEPNQITVAWTAAAANGSTITGYTVQAQIAPGGAITNVTVPGTVTSTTITGLLNCTAYDLTVIATSGGGSTESDPVQGVTPRQAPDVPSGLSLAKVPDSVGELLLSWLPSDPRGCGAVSYVVETTRPGPIVTAGSAGSATSFDYSETDPGAIAACPYPDVDCNTPRTWSFRVQASNAGGASAFSGAISGTPRLGYVRDNLYVVWATPLTGSNGTFACTACHGATNVLNLGDGADTTHNTSWSNIRTTPNVAIVTPSPSPATSLLHLCPTQSPGCTGTRLNGTAFTAHPGGQRYPAGSKEDALIVQWILDGALF